MKSAPTPPQPRRQSRNEIKVRGLPHHLTREEIKKYFEVTGNINFIFRHGTVGDKFSGTCRITYNEESGAKAAVLNFHQRKFSYGHTMSVTMFVTKGKVTVRAHDWVCPDCSHFDCVNFEWQPNCFSCGRQKPVQSSTNIIKTELEEIESNEYFEEEEEEEDEEDEEEEQPQQKEKIKETVAVVAPAAKKLAIEFKKEIDEVSLESLEMEMEDVLLNIFMNHRVFSDNLPLQVNISVSRPSINSLPHQSSKGISVNLCVNDEMIAERLKESFSENSNNNNNDNIESNPIERPAPHTSPVHLIGVPEADKENTRQEGEKNNKTMEKGRKKFTLAEDKEIIDKVLEVLPGKSLQSLEIPAQVLKVLSVTVSRGESSVSARWRGKLRRWLSQYYSHNRREWKQLQVKASQKRREDIAKYFHTQAKKSGLTLEVMNVKRKT